jgi:hypothetical protein
MAIIASRYVLQQTSPFLGYGETFAYDESSDTLSVENPA